MPDFLRGQLEPVPPELLIYVLNQREPIASIDRNGQLWLKPQAFADDPSFESMETPRDIVPPRDAPRRIPKLVFADVPTIIHTAFGFTLAPMADANDQTGPKR